MSNGFGITETGFVRKTLTDILDQKNTEVRAVYGPAANLAVQTPFGQMNQNAALSDDQLWQIAEDAFNATDPEKATGIALSNLVKINRIERQGALATTVTLSCTGTAGIEVLAGQRVSNGAGRVVTTDTAFTFNVGGTATVEATLTETGPIPIDPSTMTVIETPVAGWNTVTNLVAGVTGRDREEDGPLRVRQARSTAAASQNLIESLIGAIGNVSGVTNFLVLENDTDSTDSNGIPSHSFEVIVTGGTDVNIGNAIWSNKPFGIGSFGSTSVIISDSQNLPHAINFTRPTQIPIYVIVNITPFTGYPSDGDDLIKQAIIDYAAGTLVSGRGFNSGDDVIFSELYTPVNTVPEHSIVSLFIGTAPAPTLSDDIVINLRQVAQFTAANITINQV